MIQRVRGNLLEANVEALVNTVNTVGVMGRGVALQFKLAFPENYEFYRRRCATGEVRIGEVLTYDLKRLGNPRYIINFPTKKHWRGKSHIEYIKDGLPSLVQTVKELSIESIAIPPLGAGLGGLDWSEVFPHIDEAFAELPNVEVLVYEPSGPPRAEAVVVSTPRPKLTPGRAVLLALMKRYRSTLMDEGISLLEIHKLMYLLQEAGENLRLLYVKGVYGPYSTNLHHVLERLEGHYIRGYGDGSECPGKVIEYDEDAVKEAQSYVQNRTTTRARFERIERLVDGFDTPYGLELLTSVHWVAAHEGDGARHDPMVATQLVQAWSDRKRAMFRGEHVRAAWERLKLEGWLTRPADSLR
jgi:O-acetyl-ADP-ribose deacetylase (regulator of RNase III)